MFVPSGKNDKDAAVLRNREVRCMHVQRYRAPPTVVCDDARVKFWIYWKMQRSSRYQNAVLHRSPPASAIVSYTCSTMTAPVLSRRPEVIRMRHATIREVSINPFDVAQAGMQGGSWLAMEIGLGAMGKLISHIGSRSFPIVRQHAQ